MVESVPVEVRHKVVAVDGKFKIKIIDIGGSTKGFAPEVFDTQVDAEAFIAQMGDAIVAPTPEVKPEFVPEVPVAPEAPVEPVEPGVVAAPEAPVAPENVVPATEVAPQE